MAIARYTCPSVQRGGPFRSFLASDDTRVAFVDGDDWLALVNRSPTGALSPDYSPADLVDVRDGSARKPAECEGARECLRRDAATALKRMFDQMRTEGMEGHVQSAFRSFGTQCWVFANWAHQASGGFCEATEQSALPGHSQHQLGTTLDVFTKEWAEEGARLGEGVFRNGFGCSRGGQWLEENAWRYGFVIPYPTHPDNRRDDQRCAPRLDRPLTINPKTGYKSEPWHLRFIGVEAAARYRQAWLDSRPGTPDELTLEQWIRSQRGLVGDAELPACDGCRCGACATLASDDTRAPCGKASLWLDANGQVVSPFESPSLTGARARSDGLGGVVIEATIHTPPHTPTQPPVLDDVGTGYLEGTTFLALRPYPQAAPHRYPDLPGAWRVAIEPVAEPGDAAAPKAPTAPIAPGGPRWPWRASLASPELASTWNHANVMLPAKWGDVTVRLRVSVPPGRPLRVTLLKDGVEYGSREVSN
jgi:D-alanyl-D-alanine carboxypeptidase